VLYHPVTGEEAWRGDLAQGEVKRIAEDGETRSYLLVLS